MRGQGSSWKTVTLKVKYADFQIITRSRTAAAPIATASEMKTITLALLDPLFPTEKGIRLLGVTVSSFADESATDSDQLAFII